MNLKSCIAIALVAVLLSACGGAWHAPLPNARQGSSLRVRPAEGAGALPGEGADALPGATVPCDATAVVQGEAACTIAINVTVPPIPNPAEPVSAIPGLHPAELRALYGLPTTGQSMTVAVVDAYDDPAAEADLAVYRTAFGLPACTTQNGCFRKVNQTGSSSTYPQANVAWSDEIALDLDMVSAVCPACRILLVEARSPQVSDLGASVDRAVALGARVVSNSYYANEWSGERALDPDYRHPGVAITVSAGDATLPFYPAASPYVTAIGGTTVEGSAPLWAQTAWGYGGRGCSRYEPRPSYQSDRWCRTRSTVDMAVVGDPQTGVATFATSAGGWIVAGGTSVGAPVVAAAYALSGNPQGPAFSYQHDGAFKILGGARYTLPTGLGYPYGLDGL